MGKTTLTNKEIEHLAIDFVKTKYPNAKSMPHGSGYDLEIGGKIVEVKGTASSNYKQNVLFNRTKEYDVWRKNREKYWFLYRILGMTVIAEYAVKIHSTKDKKKLKEGIKEYEYGTINIRDTKLRDHIGKTVKVRVESKK